MSSDATVVQVSLSWRVPIYVNVFNDDDGDVGGTVDTRDSYVIGLGAY
jgi:hypothetical protein